LNYGDVHAERPEEAKNEEAKEELKSNTDDINMNDLNHDAHRA